MQKATDEAKITTVSAALKKYGVAIGTSHRHIRKADASKKLRFQPELKQKLSDLAVQPETLFYGLKKDSVQTLAYDLATQNKISHPFACEKAGRAWVEDLMARHPQLTYRAPESTALSRYLLLIALRLNTSMIIYGLFFLNISFWRGVMT